MSGDSCSSGCSLACAVCKILCYSCCRRLCCKPPPPPKPEYAVLCLGYGDAGKSTLLSTLCGDTENEPIGPTIGFAIRSIITTKAILSIKEIGGSEKYDLIGTSTIAVTKQYCGTDEELQLIKTDLSKCLEHPALKGLPLLVLCNKQDLENASPVEEVVAKMNMEQLINNERWYRAVGCSCQNMDDVKSSLEELADEMFNGRQDDDETL